MDLLEFFSDFSDFLLFFFFYFFGFLRLFSDFFGFFLDFFGIFWVFFWFLRIFLDYSEFFWFFGFFRFFWIFWFFLDFRIFSDFSDFFRFFGFPKIFFFFLDFFGFCWVNNSSKNFIQICQSAPSVMGSDLKVERKWTKEKARDDCSRRACRSAYSAPSVGPWFDWSRSINEHTHGIGAVSPTFTARPILRSTGTWVIRPSFDY